MIVTTLPILPSVARPFLSLTTIICADIVSKSMDVPFCMSMNTIGMRASKGDTDVADYVATSKQVGVGLTSKFQFHDADPEFFDYVSECLSSLLKSGQLVLKTQTISWCACGIVEIPTDFLKTASNAQFSLIQRKDTRFFCMKCKNELHSSEEKVWTLVFGENTASLRAFGCGTRQLDDSFARIRSSQRFISRNHREAVEMCIDGNKVDIDVDFYWSFFLGFLLSKYDEDILVVAGVRTTQQLAQCVALLPLARTTKVSCLIHPYVRPIGNPGLVEKSIADFLQIEHRSEVVRAFLAMGLSWKQPLSLLSTKGLYLAQVSAFPRIEQLAPDDCSRPISSLNEFMRWCRPNQLQSSFKALRSGRPLSVMEQKIIRAILSPPSTYE